LLRQQESLALKPVRRFSLFRERQTPLPLAEVIDMSTSINKKMDVNRAPVFNIGK
jgi:hypothetical protein